MHKAAWHLIDNMSAGLALDPGMSKTTIALAAFCTLQAMNQARTMLVIAPLRVCRMVWRQEGQKWTEFRHLKFSLLHGDKKDERLGDDADVWLINPEGVDWLSKKYFGRSLPFDVVCIDELTRFKNSAADRSKALRPRLKNVARRWGMTGSLAPNGYMDLFGQMLMLDDGAALGRYITHYRDQYFQVGFDGFSYDLMPGAEARILERIKPYWLQLSAEDYLELPELVPDPIEIHLNKTSRATYDKMKKQMLAELPEGIITAANSAACYSKLAQMANGAVYVGDHKEKVALIHNDKLDAVEELIEELNGQPLLIAYEFNHDIDRLRERFGKVDKATGKKVLPYLGKGTTATQEAEWIAAWNRNELPILACHPASAGHGLNLQEGNAGHVCWLGPIWDLELWDQFIRRLRRRGNQAQRVFNHILICVGTIDELKLEALGDKDTTQSRLLRALNHEIRRDGETQAGGAAPTKKSEASMFKLSRPGGATAQPGAVEANNNQSQEPAKVIKPAGWGKAAAAPKQTDIEETAPADNSQQQRMQDKLTGGEAGQGEASTARSAFSGGVREAARQISTGEERVDPEAVEGAKTDAAPATRTRRRSADKTEAVADDNSNKVSYQGPTPEERAEHKANETRFRRQRCLELACHESIIASADGPGDIVEVAKLFFAFVEGE